MAIPWDKIPWDKIIALAEKLIAGSATAGASPEEIQGQVRNPRGRTRIRLEREVRHELNMSPREWNREGAAIMEKIYAETAQADELEVQELCWRGMAMSALAVPTEGAMAAPAGAQSFPSVDIGLVTQIAQALENARKAGEALYELIKKAGGTIPGLGG
jgi:hypothetical protein